MSMTMLFHESNLWFEEAAFGVFSSFKSAIKLKAGWNRITQSGM